MFCHKATSGVTILSVLHQEMTAGVQQVCKHEQYVKNIASVSYMYYTDICRKVWGGHSQ